MTAFFRMSFVSYSDTGEATISFKKLNSVEYGAACICATSPSEKRTVRQKVDDGRTNRCASVVPAKSKRGLN